jgi:methyltransferase
VAAVTLSQILFSVLVALVAGERVAELAVCRRHRRWAHSHGAVEHGRRHYPAMALLHTGLLAGMLVEVWWAQRAFEPLLGWPMLAVAAAAQGLRWWCIRSLGWRWSTRVLVVPGLPLVTTGPYRWLRHPNYAAVVAEGVALPLVHDAWLTALVFTIGNALVLAVRLRVENTALLEAAR